MSEFADNLYRYFGVIGIASVVAWVAALVMLAAFCRSRRRTVAYAAAIGVAILALILARVNSAAVSDIQVDRSAQIEEMRQAREQQRRQARVEQRRRESATVRFAEDAPGEAADIASGGTTRPADEQDQGEQPAYSYRQRGAQQREAGKSRGTLSETFGDADDRQQSDEARVMSEADVVRANRWDRYNLFAARWTIWIVIGLVVLDYLLRFNRTFGALFPLPITGPVMDSHFRKSYAVLMDRDDGTDPTDESDPLRGCLSDAVRKGETFVYFGPADPWGGEQLSRLPRGLWPLPRNVYADGQAPYSSEVLFESAWFARHCAVIADEALARGELEDILDRLKRRWHSSARARRTVNLVWDFPAPPPRELLEELVYFGREANFRVIVRCRCRDDNPPAELFEEVHPARS